MEFVQTRSHVQFFSTGAWACSILGFSASRVFICADTGFKAHFPKFVDFLGFFQSSG